MISKFSLSDSYYLIGIGGIGMLGLAVLISESNCKIAGSDLKIGKNCLSLKKLGIPVYEGHCSDNLKNYMQITEPNKVTVIISSAIKEDNPELIFAKNLGLKIYKRGEFLSYIASMHKCSICIAGSHGKTTVTGWLTDTLGKCIKSKVGYMIGGWPVGKESTASIGDGSFFICEVDESDLSLKFFKSDIAVILNVENDHAWDEASEIKLYDAFYTFASNSKNILCNDSWFKEKYLNDYNKLKLIDSLKEINTDLTLPAAFQYENLKTVLSITNFLGINLHQALPAALTFKGMERRMSLRYNKNGYTVIEDYAHHPTEVRKAIAYIKTIYPNKNIQLAFQPHRFARLKKYFKEFADELKTVDKVYLCNVFSAWSTIDKEISIEKLAEEIGSNAVALAGMNWKKISNFIAEKTDSSCITVIMGAGDINELIPELINTLDFKANQKFNGVSAL